MESPAQTSLHIPVGINFECTGCGNCCFSWPVPLNEEDVLRLKKLADVDAQPYVRRLAVNDSDMSSFSHSLEKRPDGRCIFLDDKSRCKLHADFGLEAKPSMCQLFPYTFTPTPTGVYASLSFASTGVLANSGRPLSEQADFIRSRWLLMQKLKPDYMPDWQTAQLLDGVPISWQEYVSLDRDLLDLLRPGGDETPILQLCGDACSILSARLPSGYPTERNLIDAPPEAVDRSLIKFLLDFYLPDDVFGKQDIDLPARDLVQDLVAASPTRRLSIGGRMPALGSFAGDSIELDAPTEQLLRRFLYCRVFSKLYFGPGYNFLSVTAGLHHLCLLIALVRITIKTSGGTAGSDMFTVATEIVRKLERRLTMARFTLQSTSILEVLLTSPSRIQRILALAS